MMENCLGVTEIELGIDIGMGSVKYCEYKDCSYSTIEVWPWALQAGRGKS